MFGFFKKNREPSVEDILKKVAHRHEVGDAISHYAKDIINLATSKSDAEVATYSLTTITVMITDVKTRYHLKVLPDSIFANYLIAFQKEDLLTIAKMTRNMADILNQTDGTFLQGALIYSWFESGEYSSLGGN